MKTLEEMIAVMQAAKDGKPIEFLRKHYRLWERERNTDNLVWNWEDNDYRVAEVPISVDWNAIQDDIIAIIPGGRGLPGHLLFGCTKIPVFTDNLNEWRPKKTDEVYNLNCVKSAVRGTVTGRAAIAWRPDYVNAKHTTAQEVLTRHGIK